jgi:SET domain-containing protein
MALYKVAPSKIHGNGVIATKFIKQGSFIGVPLKLILGVFISISEDLGMYINHSWSPNAYIERHGLEWHLIANTNIVKGEEIFIDYNHTPWFIKKPLKTYT